MAELEKALAERDAEVERWKREASRLQAVIGKMTARSEWEAIAERISATVTPQGK